MVTYMRNERWLTSLGHVLAQVSCASANSYFAAVARRGQRNRSDRDKSMLETHCLRYRTTAYLQHHPGTIH